ncbi:hypothetical protein [uncultured Flavobacterium sp.]|uniref:GldL-related protein n=1 Tax=uncultured Flavobacterium sp. TaxID=165435 RepID=UPI0030EE40F2|tara:strand:+ start:125218 stop:125394 length:177 start_codon:yes stop_codon:yes gene_type:complete
MIKDYKIPFVTFLTGMAITILGTLFKIMHWQFASGLLIIGMTLEVLGIILLIRLILKK